MLSVADAFLYVPAGLQHIATNKKMQHPRSSGSTLRCDAEGFSTGGSYGYDKVKDLSWFRPDGKEMTDEDWRNPNTRCIGERLSGDAIEETDEHGGRIVDDTLLLLLNAHYESVPFVLPTHRPEQRWELVLDTQESTGKREASPAIERRFVRSRTPLSCDAPHQSEHLSLHR